MPIVKAQSGIAGQMLGMKARAMVARLPTSIALNAKPMRFLQDVAESFDFEKREQKLATFGQPTR